MKKGKVLNLGRCNKVFEFLKLNNILIILTLFFIGGLCFGIYFCSQREIFLKFAESFVSDFFDKRIDSGFFSVVVNSLFKSLLFIAITFICGSSMLGVILIPFVCSLSGMLYGVIAAFLYNGQSLNGVAFFAVMILRSAVISVIALILSSRESIKFSLLLARLTIPSTAPHNLSFDFKRFCIKYLSFSVICLIASIVDAVLSSNFIKNFNF